MTLSRLAPPVSALVGFLAVALGAFGAHALKATLSARASTEIWEKAVSYHLVHAVVLWVLGQQRPVPRSWWFFCTGIVLFSGSLYLLALVRAPWLGPITPLGGLSLLAGWLGLGFLRTHSQSNPH